MKRIIIVTAITGVVIAGAIIKAVNSLKDSNKKVVHEPDKAHELTTDFLL